MWEVAGFVAVMVVMAFVAPFIRRWHVNRKRRAMEAGRRTRVPVRAKGAPPLPKRWAWGSIDAGERPVRFRRWLRLRGVPLTGLTLLRTDVGEAPYAGEPVVVFRLRDAAGRPAALAVPESYAPLFHRALLGPPPVAPAAVVRPPRFARWTLVPAAVAVAWLATWAYLVLAATPVTATVLANAEDWCRIEFRLDTRYEAAVDCYDGERPGDPLHVLALPAPFRGEAADYGNVRWGVPLLGGLLLLPLAASVTARALARRRPAPDDVPDDASPAAVPAEVPKLERHELSYSRIAETVTRRAEVEEWELSAVPWWLRPFRTGLGRIAAASVPGIVLGPAMVVLLAVAGGLTSVRTALTYDTGAARTVTATVETIDRFVPVFPWEAEVSIPDLGGERVYVAMSREPDVGDRLTIRYDARHDVARLPDDPDAVRRGTAVAATAAGAAFAFAGWRATRLASGLRALRRARRQPGVPARYAVILGPTGDPGMLLFGADGDPRPDVVVSFADLPPGLPVTGEAVVHGTPADGAALVVEAGGALLYPAGPAEALDTATLRDVVNGDVVALADDEEA